MASLRVSSSFCGTPLARYCAPPSAIGHATSYTKKLKKETMPLNRKAMDLVEILNYIIFVERDEVRF